MPLEDAGKMPIEESTASSPGQHVSSPSPEAHPDGKRRWVPLLLGLFAVLVGALVVRAYLKADGGNDPAQSAAVAKSTLTAVHVVHPQVRRLTYTVTQPGILDAYEQTSIYSKVSGFIEKFYVDIGQEIKCGDLLAEIFVPELDEDYQQKVAQMELDKKGIQQAQQMVTVAESHIQSAIALVNEARANVGKYQAAVVRWESEFQRLKGLVADRVMDKQVLDETQKQRDAARYARDAGQASLAANEADRQTREADLGKARIDVEVARAKVEVDAAETRRAAALLAYTHIAAPYDGVVTVRNANTGDSVQAGVEGKAGSGAMPLFVVARDDIARIFVDVPEAYARYVEPGTKALVRAEALNGVEIPAAVTRTSWSLDTKTRRLRAEIDLPIKRYHLRPGMYVYGNIIINRPDVQAVPQGVLTILGNQTYCYLLRHGKAVKTAVEQGLSDGTWVEVLRKQVGGAWQPFTPADQILSCDLSELADGQEVAVQPEKSP